MSLCMKVESRADSKDVMNRFRLPIFAGNLVEFHGFEACELAHMQEVLVANGGKVTRSPAERTHLVVNEHSVEVLPASLEVSEGCHLVKGEWFWRSIQIDAAAKVSNYGWLKGQKTSRSIEEFSTQIGDQVEVQFPHLDYQSSFTAEKKEDLCVILVCWFGIALKAMEAATASFANA